MGEKATSLSSIISGLDFSAISSNILDVIAATATVTIGIIAIKKGYNFLKRQLKGA